MLPTSLLTELYDQEISQAEFEALLTLNSHDHHHQGFTYASSLTSRSSSPSTDEDSFGAYPPRSATSYSSCSGSSMTSGSSSASSNLPEAQKVEEPLGSSPPTFWIPLDKDEKVNRRNYRLSLLQTTPNYSGTRVKYCSFCFHNQESECVYTSHDLRDSAQNVTCPALFAVVCRACGATGPDAHTPKYCPRRRQPHMQQHTILKRVERDS